MNEFMMNSRMSSKGQGQQGFMLLEMSLALLIFTALMLLKMNYDYQELLDVRATNAGQSMATVQNALNTTMALYSDSFVNMPAASPAPVTITVGTGSTQYTVSIADGYHPTIQNLVALGQLPQNFAQTTSVGGNFTLYINKLPVGCVAPNCNLEGLVVINTPFVINGIVDEKRMNLAIRAIGSDGGGTTKENPGTISGLAGQWSTALPANITPARALLAARAGYGSSAWAPYFRVDGSRWMTGNFNGGGNDILNVNETLSVLHAVNDPCTDPGAVGSGVVNGVGVVMVCSNGSWQVQTGITAAPGSACLPDGTIATSSATGEELVCKNGAYVRLVSLIDKNVNVSRVLVIDQQRVQKPTCDAGGTANYSFNMNMTSVDVSSAPPKQSMSITAVDQGTSWLVNIVLIDDTGATTSGNVYNLSTMMNLECHY